MYRLITDNNLYIENCCRSCVNLHSVRAKAFSPEELKDIFDILKEFNIEVEWELLE